MLITICTQNISKTIKTQNWIKFAILLLSAPPLYELVLPLRVFGTTHVDEERERGDAKG